VRASAGYLSPSEAAKRLGVSVKALRLYEQRGLITPSRTATGWRVYGPDAMARAAAIADLRKLGLGLAEIERALNDGGLEPVLAAHQAALESRIRALAATVEKVRSLRCDRRDEPGEAPAVAFDLPWPWGGERFELRDIPAITYITGPLGSGKTRLARRLAETLPGGLFLGLERPADGLIAALETGTSAPLVVDMVEQGLDPSNQRALIAALRSRGATARPLFLMTRSSAILDLAEVGADETILYCPANHSPPLRVTPVPGALGYEAVATCLATPEVRARTAGVAEPSGAAPVVPPPGAMRLDPGG
jgi:DNA-binding transcriptional MerR regulator